MSANLSAVLYLVSGVLFILALRGLSSPVTSRRGNIMGMTGMVNTAAFHHHEETFFITLQGKQQDPLINQLSQ